MKHKHHWLLVAGVLLIGANLRAPITAVGPLIPQIQQELNLNSALAGFLTTLPLLAFALLSPFVPTFARRLGMERILFFSLILLGLGVLTRSLTGETDGGSLLFIGTLLIGLAIATGNVLLPSFIKLKFPLQIGLMTGIYAVGMNVFGALASGISVPLASLTSLDWRGALGFWLGLVLLAVVIWLPQLVRLRKNVFETVNRRAGRVKDVKDKSRIWKSPLAWQVTIFMGLQSMMFYTLLTWLPEILQQNEYSDVAAGWMLFLLQLAIIPMTFIVPLIAGEMSSQRGLAGMAALCFFLGTLGLLTGISWLLILSIVIIGIGSGSAFSLAMMFFTLRTKDSMQAAKLSGMAQSFGYLLAAIGPVVFGGIHDLTQNWFISLGLLIVVSVVIGITGICAGRSRLV